MIFFFSRNKNCRNFIIIIIFNKKTGFIHMKKAYKKVMRTNEIKLTTIRLDYVLHHRW